MIGGLWGVFVIFGAHRALLPIGLNDVAINGRQNILAFANNGVLTIFTYAAFGMTQFLFYLVGIAVALFGAVVFTYIVWSPDKKNQEEVEEKDKQPETYIEICSPLEGKAIPLSKVTDEVFASGELGQGVAIVPKKGEIVAPADGVVTVIYTTLHAVGMQLDCGVEILIHVGVDTVHLNGKYFTKHVEEGAHITKGTKIISFDLQRIIQEGYDVITPVIVVNTGDYKNISQIRGPVTNDTVLLLIKQRR